MTSTVAAPLVEVFVSFQGEGPHAGAPTLFVRSAGCPLRCTYCDTVHSYRAPPSFPVRGLDGGLLAEVANPAAARALLDGLPEAALVGVVWLSFTGGEPLLFPDFATGLFEAARGRRLRTLLETAAVHPEALRRVLPLTDHLAMDFKLASTLHGGEDTASAHVACLATAAASEVETSVKIVLTPGVSDDEWRGCLALLAPFRSRFTLVIQPVTPCLDEPSPLPRADLLRRAADALAAGFDLRVLPQLHKLLGLD